MARWSSRKLDPARAGGRASIGASGVGQIGHQGVNPAGDGDDIAALRARNGALVARINRSGGVLPPAAMVAARLVTDQVTQALSLAAASPVAGGGDMTSLSVPGLDVASRVQLAALIDDYLPTSLNAYVTAARGEANGALPHDFARFAAQTRRANPGGQGRAAGTDAATAQDRATGQLLDQLAALRRSAAEIADRARAAGAQAFEIQGAFLSAKFAGDAL